MELIAILIIVGVLLLIEQLIFRKYVLRGVSYSVRFSVHEAMEGETLEIVEEIINDKKLPVPWVKTELCTSRWLQFSCSSAARASDERFVPSIFSLRPGQKCTRRRKITALKRGTFRLENVSLVGTDLFGLISVSKTVPVNESIRILPAPYELSEGDLSDKELYGEIAVRRFICDDPFLISGAREYTGREPMSRIHWQSTARTGTLMAYNNDYSTDNRCLIILNLQKSSTGDPRPLLTGDTETYIKAAAFVIDMMAKRGTRVSLAVNGSATGGVFADGGRDREAYVSLLRTLSDVENYCDTDFHAFSEKLNYKSFTDIFLLTAYIDEKMLQLAEYHKRKGRNVVFYCNDKVSDDFQIIRMGRVNRYYFMNSEE